MHAWMEEYTHVLEDRHAWWQGRLAAVHALVRKEVRGLHAMGKHKQHDPHAASAISQPSKRELHERQQQQRCRHACRLRQLMVVLRKRSKVVNLKVPN